MAKVKWNVPEVDASLEELTKKIELALQNTTGYDDCPAYIRDRLTYIRLMLGRQKRAVVKLRERLPKGKA